MTKKGNIIASCGITLHKGVTLMLLLNGSVGFAYAEMEEAEKEHFQVKKTSQLGTQL